MQLNEATAVAEATAPAHDTPPTTAVATPQVWFDGRMVAIDSPQAPLTTHAMHYGSGVFEGIRSYATVDGGAAVFRLPEHMERMRKGAELLGIDFDVDAASEAVLKTLRANNHRDAYIRPLAWLGSGTIGLDVAPLTQHMMVATMATAVHLAGKAARLGVSGWRRNPATSLPPLKLCGGYINSVLAKREAKARGFDEALFVDGEGFVVECTGANVFMVKNGSITAASHPDALDGITRATLVELTSAHSRPVSLQELKDADEVFVVGTAAEVAPIASLDEREYGDNPLTRKFQALYGRIVRGGDSTYSRWLTAV
ncbi:aminotransferase class IV [Marilutibacter alkalisoli]|uniref:Aminodeoxychorismate lyase n=1 Tax=Marilutibacter alkalisoli TaxID=2591633 RepID=A0A514BQ00_9GAMM|nr:aminotransferase class IV [Lysobacter alkalisoli]QDH69109.1 branched chain amino acid aminotransferase [Lysobacter alkalisoli]